MKTNSSRNVTVGTTKKSVETNWEAWLLRNAPRLRGRFRCTNHVLGDGRLGHIDSQFQQLPMDSRCAPEWKT
jgi:hypothetical protein